MPQDGVEISGILSRTEELDKCVFCGEDIDYHVHISYWNSDDGPWRYLEKGTGAHVDCYMDHSIKKYLENREKNGM
ncbi:MAG: hypothetical protein KAS32_31625 [Candidatus Peribacteraceae bacterium]|nr:hypothetical protein [Candidatus Peribacteraceae bacterium]